MAFGLAKSDKNPKDEEEALEAAGDSPEASAGITEADAVADPPLADGQTGEEVRQRAPMFRPSFLEEERPARGATVEPEPPPAPEGDAFFVSVAKNGGAETHRFDSPASAQSFVEQQLEEGVPQEHVTAFIGRRLELRVRHRPVVKLLGHDD